MDNLSVEAQWNLYLKRGGLDPSILPPDQYIETRRAFYAGVAQTLILLRDDITEVSGDDEQKGIAILEGLMREVSDFWQAEEATEEMRRREIRDYYEARKKSG